MNIVVITNSYPNQSKPYAGHHVARHVELHRQAGLNVKVLHPGDSRSGLIFTTWKYLRLWLLVLWTAVSHPIDLVHAHWVLPAGLFGAFQATLRRKPLVITSHGAFTNTFNQRSRLVRFLVRIVLNRAEKIIAVGKEQQEIIANILGQPVESIACINMGVSMPQTAVTRQQARQQLCLPSDKQIVLFIGNLLKRKGSDLLIKAVAELPDKSNLRVFIGGQGPESQPLKAQILALGLEETVEMIGAVLPENVFTWLRAADLCVVPSRTEPFGLVAIESLACGTPVIAARVGGLTESVQHGRNGLLFPVGDHQALAKCLEQLLANTDLRMEMAQLAPESVGRFDMRSQAEKVMEIYKQAGKQAVSHD